MGTPPNPADYNCTQENGVQVCVQNDVQTLNDELTIGYAKFLFRESLTVDGIAY